jgi:hypothetical protein
MPSPSLIHEGVIALVRNKPAFAASLLRDLFNEEIPLFDEARLTEASLNDLVPIEYRADAVVLFDIVYNNKKPVFGTIFEVQLDRKDRKGYTWPLYGVAARARYECPFVVTVVTPDPAVARWASEPVECGNGMIFRARVIGPDIIPKVTDHDQAMREPQLAVLSLVAHGGGDVDVALAIARAAVIAVSPLPDEQQVLYSHLIKKTLSEAVRKALAMDHQIEKFFTEADRLSHDQVRAEGKVEGKAEGKAEGKVEALMMLVEQRGLAITEEQRRKILACKDLPTAERWLRRAISAASVDELLA